MENIKKILSICVLIILLPILFISLVILINSYTNPDEIPSFFGWKPFIVLSGSMETEINAGDVAVVKEVNLDVLKIGDIIAFKEEDVVITHRITDIVFENGEVRYLTKGDNNNSLDRGYVLGEQIEGIYRFKIGGLGNFAMFLQTPIGLVVCLSIPILLLVFAQGFDSRRSKK